jgi:hypothetical protein
MVLNVLDFDMNVQAAIEAPRVRAFEGTRVAVEGHITPAVVADLASRGHDVRALPEWTWAVGGGHGIGVNAERNILSGGADPRRDGAAVAFCSLVVPPRVAQWESMRTMPRVPSTVTVMPSRRTCVPTCVPTTAGRPNSRATIAQWHKTPPESATIALTVANRGTQVGTVISHTMMSPCWMSV